MSSKKSRNRNRAQYAHGDAVIVDAHCGCEGDGGGSVELRGERLTVAGTNARNRHPVTGEVMVGCRTENGALINVPARALRRDD